MKTVTIDQVVAWGPCGLSGEDDGRNYTRERIERLFAGRSTLNARDISTLNVPNADKLWALLHNEFLTDEQMHLFACDCAEQVVHLCGDDPRPRAAIAAKRAWLRCEISDQELAAARDAVWAGRAAVRAAARDAIWAAARDTAWVAAWANAQATAWAAARANAWATTRAAAGDWQLARLLEYIGGAPCTP
jgi:hypothetical protein